MPLVELERDCLHREPAAHVNPSIYLSWALWLLYARNTQPHNDCPARVLPSEDMSSIGTVEPTRSQAAHEHIASRDAGSTTQQPTGTDNQAASESNMPSVNQLVIAYLIMAFLRNHTTESWSNTGHWNTLPHHHHRTRLGVLAVEDR